MTGVNHTLALRTEETGKTDLNEDIVRTEANLEGKAFDLSKGCYPGQEAE